ncbi:EAL domain-containing protein [Blautia sp.]|uniref:EAL domain-containing protein n=1 Tax=Blautia sp. TaxID=1955243 RepID=UPI003FD8AF04
MEYINCFQITSLVLVTMIAIHYFSHKRLNNAENRNFVCFLAFSGVYVLLDMLSAVIAGGGSSEGCRMSALVLTLYYFCDVILTYGLFCYIRIITGRQKEKYKWLKTGWVVLPAAMLLAVTANLRTGWLFYFDQEGRFIRGSFHFLLYGYVFFFMLVIVAFMLLYGKTAEKEIRRTIWRFWFIEAACLFLQIAAERILLTGFGLSVGLWLIYLTMNNPGEYTDSMTGLFDKQYFDKWIGEKLYRKESFHLLAVDARNMKQINRIYGTRVGDQLLIRAAKGFREITDSVQIFRITGNCFLAVLDSLTDYEKARDGIEEFLKKPFFIENEKVSFHAAICGIMNAEKLEKEDSILSYIEYMISLIQNRQDTVLIQSDSKILEGFRYEQEVEHFLQKAVKEDLFEVYYQPVYSIKNQDFITLEALSRLKHPVLGMIPPDVFIGIIQGYGLDPGYFQFEITENVATEYSESFCAAIDDFAEVGIHMCLDDFGSGYANLNAVLRIPFSAVKMDRSLLSGVSSDPQTATFYRSIVMILQHMGYKVIAEGAETEKEVKLLEKWGVDMIQGYYFSRPLCEEKLLEKIS